MITYEYEYSRDILGKSANVTGPKRLFGKWDILQTSKTLSNNLSSVNWLWSSIYRAQIALLQEKLSKFQEKAVRKGPLIWLT